MEFAEESGRGIAAPFCASLMMIVGLTKGFVSVTLAYLLAQAGVGVDVIAGIVSLNLLPLTLQFLLGPVIDLGLTSKRWYGISSIATLLCLLSFSVVPVTGVGLIFVPALSLLMGIMSTLAGISGMVAMTLTSAVSSRGALAGWRQAGSLGGVGIGGGFGLWLAAHGGGLPVAVALLALLGSLGAAPILWLKLPADGPQLQRSLLQKAALLRSATWSILHSRGGALAGVLIVLPAGLGAATGLLSAVAGDWQASEDLVAMSTGAFSGVATVCGAVLGGYVCQRYRAITVFICSALMCAAGEAAMALAPHTPLFFVVGALGNAALVGFSFTAVTTVALQQLRAEATGTVYTIFESLADIPLVAVTWLAGWIQVRHGSAAMLFGEAGLACVALLAYGLIVRLWRPPTDAILAEAEAT
jgi:MFS family permease